MILHRFETMTQSAMYETNSSHMMSRVVHRLHHHFLLPLLSFLRQTSRAIPSAKLQRLYKRQQDQDITGIE